MIYQHPNIAPRAFIFAHELAHNLNAAHDEDSANALPNNIMELTPNDGSNGFSQASIDSIMHELLDPNNTCIHIEIVSADSVFQLTQPPISGPIPWPTTRPTPEPTNLPTKMPTNGPSPRPTPVPTPRPTPGPTPRPTPGPSLRPTLVPNPRPTHVPTPEPESTSSNTPVPTTYPVKTPFKSNPTVSTECSFDKSLQDPICIVANNDGISYACYSKQDIILAGSTSDCVDRFSITIDSCNNDFVPDITSGETQVGGRMLEPNKSARFTGMFQRRNLMKSMYKVGNDKSNSGGGSNSLTCQDSCSEVGDQICFQASTTTGLERWYTVVATVSDLINGESYTTGYYAMVQSISETDARFAVCTNQYSQCSGRRTKRRGVREKELRRNRL